MASSAIAPLSRLRTTSIVILALIVVQAILGFVSLSGHDGVNGVHGGFGYLNLVAGIVATVFASQASKVDASLKGLFMHAMSLPIIAVIQIGIIEGSHGTGPLKWVHVVLGLVYLLAAAALYMIVDKKRRA